MDSVEIARAVAQLPLAGAFAFAILAFVRGWVITAGRFDEMREDRDYWRAVGLRALGVAEKASERHPGIGH